MPERKKDNTWDYLVVALLGILGLGAAAVSLKGNSSTSNFSQPTPTKKYGCGCNKGIT